MTYKVTEGERFLREELAEIRDFMRRKTPDIVRAPMFSGLVENGGFDNGTVGFFPTRGASISSSNSQLRVVSGNIEGGAAATKVLPAHAGRSYKISVEAVAKIGGRLRVAISDNSTLSTNGTVADYSDIAEGATVTHVFSENSLATYLHLSQQDLGGHTAIFDNVSMWEVDPSDNAPWFRLPYGQRVGKRGFIFRDGPRLMSNEYEEIFHGDQAFIKPLVAPGVNTEFDVYCGVGA